MSKFLSSLLLSQFAWGECLSFKELGNYLSSLTMQPFEAGDADRKVSMMGEGERRWVDWRLRHTSCE